MRHPTELLPDPLPTEPLAVVVRWLAESVELRRQPNPNAMVIATASPDGLPSARIVLCKEIAPVPGYLVFYTNYQSEKGQQLAANPRAAAVLHWDYLHRQVRVTGPVVRSPQLESDAYFVSRPWQSRIGAWASAQSQPIAGRAALKAAVLKAAERFGTPSPDDADEEYTAAGSRASGESHADDAREIHVPRPPHWGGFRLWAESVELWVEGEARIHDRARWARTLTRQEDGSFVSGPWSSTRLQP